MVVRFRMVIDKSMQAAVIRVMNYQSGVGQDTQLVDAWIIVVSICIAVGHVA